VPAPRSNLAVPVLAGCLLVLLGLALWSPDDALARKRCGKISSTSAYEKAKVIAIRGVGCSKARKVARRYDHESEETGRWQCSLAHNDPPRLFSCGRGGDSGDVRDWPHALVAKGVGEPSQRR
jgi:hypothetical protein